MKGKREQEIDGEEEREFRGEEGESRSLGGERES